MQIPPLSANRLSNYFLAKGERRGWGGGEGGRAKAKRGEGGGRERGGQKRGEISLRRAGSG